MQPLARGQIVRADAHGQQIVGEVGFGRKRPETIAQQALHTIPEQPCESRVADIKRRKQDQSLVRGGFIAQGKGSRCKSGESEDVRQLDGKERRIALRRAPVVALHIDCRRGTDHQHEPCQHHGGLAESAMQVGPLAADEQHLSRKHDKPAEEHDSMHMYDERERWLMPGNMADDLRYEATENAEPEQHDISEEEIAIGFAVGRKRRALFWHKPDCGFDCHATIPDLLHGSNQTTEVDANCARGWGERLWFSGRMSPDRQNGQRLVAAVTVRWGGHRRACSAYLRAVTASRVASPRGLMPARRRGARPALSPNE